MFGLFNEHFYNKELRVIAIRGMMRYNSFNKSGFEGMWNGKQ